MGKKKKKSGHISKNKQEETNMKKIYYFHPSRLDKCYIKSSCE